MAELRALVCDDRQPVFGRSLARVGGLTRMKDLILYVTEEFRP